ncbi:unnamed protein product [Pedinophyceae sp. YPF-701]|nr:unnamed protein product [Pedinophyceae sp. YPF-701]
MLGISETELYALGLSTFAGLTTTIGATLAIVKRPDRSLLAFLLGLAIGVMSSLSVVELWWHSAQEHGMVSATVAVVLGAAFFTFLRPLIPEVSLPYEHSHKDIDVPAARPAQSSADRRRRRHAPSSGSERTSSNSAASDGAPAAPGPGAPPTLAQRRELLRLGVLMAVTMTLHNMPEGVAVASSAFTGLGPIMCLAIAAHNIPEGIVVAAPVYAATGSRSQAFLLAAASGLSEPVGAVVALVFLRQVDTSQWMGVLLAFVGGIMTAVCATELLPEGRKCDSPRQLALGTVVGAAVMVWTLQVGA